MPAGDLITADGQLEWRGLVLGAASPYRLTKLEGWLDLAEVRGQDTPRPNRHGLYQGSQLMGRRTITVSFLIKGAPLADAVRRLRAATAPTEQPLEEPLVVRLDGRSLLANARCVRRSIDVAKHYAVGLTAGAIQWQATDPRLYSTEESRQSTGLAARQPDGLPFPLAFPLLMGSGRPGGALLAANAGDVAVWPEWTVQGPVLGPVITNQDTGQSLVFDPTFAVLEGQRLVIDTDRRTVLLNGVDRNDRLLRRDWFPIPAAGAVRVGFLAERDDPAALLTGRWRDATI